MSQLQSKWECICLWGGGGTGSEGPVRRTERKLFLQTRCFFHFMTIWWMFIILISFLDVVIKIILYVQDSSANTRINEAMFPINLCPYSLISFPLPEYLQKSSMSPLLWQSRVLPGSGAAFKATFAHWLASAHLLGRQQADVPWN